MTSPTEHRRFHLPSFLLGVAATLLVGGVALAVKACPPEPVPVDGQTTGKPVGQP